MHNNYLSIIAIAILCFFAFSYRNTNEKYCRSHNSFMFHCHHNDTNTDIYLRRLIAKLDKVLEQTDKIPEEKDKDAIEEAAIAPKMMVSCILHQLELLKSGKLHTGFMAAITPNFLRSDEDTSFDHDEDVIVCWTTENLHYTKEEAELLRATLPERGLHPNVILSVGLSKIRGALPPIIMQVLVEIIISENNYITPIDLHHRVYKRYHQMDKNSSKTKLIMKAIEDSKIKDLDRLEQFIRETFAANA